MGNCAGAKKGASSNGNKKLVLEKQESKNQPPATESHSSPDKNGPIADHEIKANTENGPKQKQEQAVV